MTNRNKKENKTVIKILSVVLAIFLWAIVMESENPTIESEVRNVPVVLENYDALAEKNLVVISPAEPKVTLTIEGKRNKVNRLDRSKITVSVDMKDIDEENNKAPVNVDLPKEFELVSVSNEMMEFDIDRITEERIDITLEKYGDLPDKDAKIASVEMNPGAIGVKGPSRQIKKIDKAKAVLDLSKITGDGIINQTIEIVDTEDRPVENIQKSTESTNISVKLHHGKTVDVRLNTVGEAPAGIEVTKIEPEKSTIDITGPEELIDNIKTVETEPFDLSAITESGERTAVLKLPEGVETVDGSDRIRIRVEAEALEEKRFEITEPDIDVTDVREGTEYKLELPGSIQVTVAGTTTELQSITPADLKLGLSLGNNYSGAYNFPLDVKVPEGTEPVSVTPQQIKVNIVQKDEPETNGDRPDDDAEDTKESEKDDSNE